MVLAMFWWLGLSVAAFGSAVSAWAMVIRGRARGRLRCRKCWYDMNGAVAAGADGDTGDGGTSGEVGAGTRTCPECGRIATCEKHLLKTRRHWRLALLGLIVMAAGAGTSAWPMLSAKHWQRYAPAAVLVLVADASEPTATDETWKELATRARYDQLAKWQRGILAGKLGKGLAGMSTATADEHVELISLLRPPASEGLAIELIAYSKIIEREQDEYAKRSTISRTTDTGYIRFDPIRPVTMMPDRRRHMNEAISYAGTDIGRDELIRLLKREDSWWVDEGAAPGLSRIGDEQAIGALCDHLVKHPLDLGTLCAIASIGPRAIVQAEPVLLGLMESASTDGRQNIEYCLAVLRGESGDITVELTHDTMREAPAEYSAIWIFFSLLWTERWPFYAPGSPGHPERAVPVLIEYLGSETANVRNSACELLRVIGPNARPALPALNALLNDPEVATQAQSAIDAIRRPD